MGPWLIHERLCPECRSSTSVAPSGSRSILPNWLSPQPRMDQQEKSQFVQIAVAMAPQQANLIYALDNVGGVWFYRDTKKKWTRVSEEREE